jgi:hypothetical protein
MDRFATEAAHEHAILTATFQDAPRTLVRPHELRLRLSRPPLKKKA